MKSNAWLPGAGLLSWVFGGVMQSRLDLRMCDGRRQFGTLPCMRPWGRVPDWVQSLLGARLNGLVSGDATEAWIDFSLAGHRFTVNNPCGEHWLCVADPPCPDA